MLYLESEHQELLFRGIDPGQPLELHIPSALGPLDYFVCLRLAPAAVCRFDRAVVSARLDGLRPTDVSCRTGDGLVGQRVIPAADGKVWLFLCRMPMARGDGTLAFSELEELPAGGVDLLLCTWRRFIDSGQADDLVRCLDDPHWAPSGVPLGGIGTGRVDICRDGRFRNFSGNNNQDMPFEEPDGLNGAYLALAADGQQRLLATRPMAGIAPCADLAFEPAFPQAVLRSPQILPGLDAEVLLSGPLVPHDLKTSSLPAALLRWQVSNHSESVRTVSCTIDQRLGAHPATQLLFPQLNAVELGLFAANQDKDGAINHDLGGGHLDKGVASINWPDLCCSFVIQHARHAWTTGDRQSPAP